MVDCALGNVRFRLFLVPYVHALKIWYICQNPHLNQLPEWETGIWKSMTQSPVLEIRALNAISCGLRRFFHIIYQDLHHARLGNPKTSSVLNTQTQRKMPCGVSLPYYFSSIRVSLCVLDIFLCWFCPSCFRSISSPFTTHRDMERNRGREPQRKRLALQMGYRATADRVGWRPLAVASRARRLKDYLVHEWRNKWKHTENSLFLVPPTWWTGTLNLSSKSVNDMLHRDMKDLCIWPLRCLGFFLILGVLSQCHCY